MWSKCDPTLGYNWVAMWYATLPYRSHNIRKKCATCGNIRHQPKSNLIIGTIVVHQVELLRARGFLHYIRFIVDRWKDAWISAWCSLIVCTVSLFSCIELSMLFENTSANVRKSTKYCMKNKKENYKRNKSVRSWYNIWCLSMHSYMHCTFIRENVR